MTTTERHQIDDLHSTVLRLVGRLEAVVQMQQQLDERQSREVGDLAVRLDRIEQQSQRTSDWAKLAAGAGTLAAPLLLALLRAAGLG